MRASAVKERAKQTTEALLVVLGVGCFLLAGWLSGCRGWNDPVDPTQPPCGGRDVYYGEYCCNVNGAEWKCPVEAACGYEPDDCRSIEPSERRQP